MFGVINMYEKQIGKRIQEYRKIKGLTQDELAEKVGISKSYISSIERGLYSPHLDIMVKIMNSIGCSADEIFVDVVKSSCKVKSSVITEQIENLPLNEQNRIFDVLNVLVKHANK